jgi:hypothetical protein
MAIFDPSERDPSGDGIGNMLVDVGDLLEVVLAVIVLDALLAGRSEACQLIWMSGA